MTTLELTPDAPPTCSEQRARWRTLVGLECPSPSARHLDASRALPGTAPWAATTNAGRSGIRR